MEASSTVGESVVVSVDPEVDFPVGLFVVISLTVGSFVKSSATVGSLLSTTDTVGEVVPDSTDVGAVVIALVCAVVESKVGSLVSGDDTGAKVAAIGEPVLIIGGGVSPGQNIVSGGMACMIIVQTMS